MKNEFTLHVTPEEKSFLHDLVRWSIARRLSGEVELSEDVVPKPPSRLLTQELGAFVTLKHDGLLRGCIGTVAGEQPLYLTVAAMAQAAAFDDPRFPPLTSLEFQDITVDISIMGPITQCGDITCIEVGKHGLIVRQGRASGLLLPQVAEEQRWDRETFISQTCVKAGLPANCWKQEHVQIYWFEAVVV